MGNLTGDAKTGLLDLDDPADDEVSLADSGTVPRQTLVPRSFDARAFAEEYDDDDSRDRLPTLTNEEALEEARQASFPTHMPPPASRRGSASWTSPPPSGWGTSGPASSRGSIVPVLGVSASHHSTRPGSVTYESDAPDSQIEIDAGEDDLDELGEDEQEAILRERLAPMARVPMLATKLSDLGDVLADPKTAYVLGFVDAILPLETIVEVTGLPELETLRIVDRMIAQGVIVFRAPLNDR